MSQETVTNNIILNIFLSCHLYVNKYPLKLYNYLFLIFISLVKLIHIKNFVAYYRIIERIMFFATRANVYKYLKDSLIIIIYFLIPQVLPPPPVFSIRISFS